MYFWIINLFLVFLLCVFIAGIVIPQILLIAFRRQLFDEPDERKIHHSTVPRLGGVAFTPVILFAISLLLGIDMLFGHSEIFEAVGNEALTLSFGLCALIMLYLVGIADDLVGVRYIAKFFVQILCGIMLIAGGLYFDDFHGTLFIHELPLWIAWPLTVLIVVFIINAINLIDGIDGLASGLCGIAFVFYGVVFCMLHEYIYALMAIAGLGVLVPFFYYNVFGNAEQGKKIFMGDAGSLTIGVIICVLSFKMAMCAPERSLGNPNPLVRAFAPLLVPCFDVVRVYFHRIRNKKNPFLPDKNHIHHKLLAIGMKQHNAMITIILTSLFLTLMNVTLSRYITITPILFIDMALLTAVNMWLSDRIKVKNADKDTSKE